MLRSLPFRRSTLVLLAGLVLLALFLMLLDSRNQLDGPKSLVVTIVSPIGETLTDLGDQVSNIGEGGNENLRQQLADVTEERDQLLHENAQLREQGREVEQLRDLLEFRQANPQLALVTAEVVSRDPGSREQYVIINQGSNAGIEVGMPVLSPHFLVGQVTEVEPDRARVLLIIDSSFQTGARIQGLDAEGIVYGRWQFGERVVMRHLPVDVQVSTDALVVTSGKTDRVPPGLVIGKVMKVDRDEVENETTLDILPLVDFAELSSVTVITGESGETGTP
ncbi:MAG TPA: rod shape-determining protein MreC [Thermomicrobiales bacterium]|nr:rod shape-determining protein MreC [Thermomicrobiales bacterium]